MPKLMTAVLSPAHSGGAKSSSDDEGANRLNPIAKKAKGVAPTPSNHNNKPRTIVIPPGKLGLTVEIVANIGAYIKAIHHTNCPVKDEVQVGDYIVAINGRRPQKAGDMVEGNDGYRRVCVVPERLAESTVTGEGSNKREARITFCFEKPKIISIPNGKLGITLEFTANRGAYIKGIDPACPIKHDVQIGDYIISNDGRRCTKPEDLSGGRRSKEQFRQFGIVSAKLAKQLEDQNIPDTFSFLRGQGWLYCEGESEQTAKKRKFEEMESTTTHKLSEVELVRREAEKENKQLAHIMAHSDGWEYRCRQLIRYKRSQQAKGMLRKKNIPFFVPVTYKAPDDMTLGEWVREQQRLYKLGKLDPERVKWLEKEGIDFKYGDLPSVVAGAPNQTGDGTAEQQQQQQGGDSAKEIPVEKKKTQAERKNDSRIAAAKALAPRFSSRFTPGNDDFDKMEWKAPSATDAERVSKTSAYYDATDLRAMVMTISRMDPDRAVRAIVQFLRNDSNKQIKKEVRRQLKLEHDEEDPETKIEKYIIAGIKGSIAHHTPNRGGSRPIVAETFVKSVTFACLFEIVKRDKYVTDGALSKVIGTSCRQVELARVQVQDVLDSNGTISSLNRKTRKDCIRDKVEPYIFDFLRFGDCTRPDTRRGPESKKGLVEVVDPRSGETVSVPRRLWVKENKKQQHQEFVDSEYYAAFQRDHDGAKLGYTVWSQLLPKLGKFVFKPPGTRPENNGGNSSSAGINIARENEFHRYLLDG